MLTLIVVSHVICSRVQHTKHKLFVGLFQNDWRVFIGPVAEQFVVHEPHLQYNEDAYALLSELVLYFRKSLEVTQSKAYSNDSYDCISLTPVGCSHSTSYRSMLGQYWNVDHAFWRAGC